LWEAGDGTYQPVVDRYLGVEGCASREGARYDRADGGSARCMAAVAIRRTSVAPCL
jgi:hypothetical protein